MRSVVLHTALPVLTVPRAPAAGDERGHAERLEAVAHKFVGQLQGGLLPEAPAKKAADWLCLGMLDRFDTKQLVNFLELILDGTLLPHRWSARASSHRCLPAQGSRSRCGPRRSV